MHKRKKVNKCGQEKRLYFSVSAKALAKVGYAPAVRGDNVRP